MGRTGWVQGSAVQRPSPAGRARQAAGLCPRPAALRPTPCTSQALCTQPSCARPIHPTHRGHQVDEVAIRHGLRVGSGQVAPDCVAAVLHLQAGGGRMEGGVGGGRVELASRTGAGGQVGEALACCTSALRSSRAKQPFQTLTQPAAHPAKRLQAGQVDAIRALHRLSHRHCAAVLHKPEEWRCTACRHKPLHAVVQRCNWLQPQHSHQAQWPLASPAHSPAGAPR